MNRSKQQLRITVICSSHLRQRTKNVSQTAATAWIGHETKALCLDVLAVMAFSTVFSFSVLWEKCVVPVFKSTASSHQFNSFQSLGIIYWVSGSGRYSHRPQQQLLMCRTNFRHGNTTNSNTDLMKTPLIFRCCDSWGVGQQLSKQASTWI